MNESPATYEITKNEFVITRTYTLYMEQIGKLSDMQQRTGKNQSELVRQAIDLLFETTNQEAGS